MQHFEFQPFTKRVLVIGTNALHLAGLLNSLYESGYDTIGALTDEEAIRFFYEHDPHILIITQHVDTTSREAFKKDFFEKKPTLTLFELSGGVSALKLLLENTNNT